MPLGLVVVILVLAGVASGVLGPLGGSDAGALAIALVSVSLLVERTAVRRVLMLGCVFAAATCDGTLARDRALNSPLLAWFDEFTLDNRAGDAVNLQGTLAEDASPTATGVRLSIDVRQIFFNGAWRRILGRVQTHVAGEMAAGAVTNWTAGRAVIVPVVLRRPQSWRNPGSPSERWQRLRRTVDLVGTIKSAALIVVERGTPWDEAAARVRQHVRNAATRYVAPHSTQSAAIVAAILIGDRAGLADDVQRRLRAAGTYHVIAISGGNVAILTALCFAMLRLLIRSFRAVAVITMIMVVSYGWLVGGDPSVRRAITAACLYLALGLIGVVPRAINVLGVVAIIVALVDPLTVIDAGAWLSFGATLGIVVCAARFVKWARAGRESLETPAGRIAAMLGKVWLATLGLFSATVAAEAVLLPISAAVFSRVSVFGLVLNFIAIPAMAVVQMAGFLMVALTGWWNSGAAVAARVADAGASLLVNSSSVVDAAPWLSWRVPPVSLVWTLFFYAGFAAFVWLRGWRWPRLLAAATGLVSLAVIVIAPGLELAGPPTGWLRVTMIDVGQGDALLVQFPTGHSLLVDAGGVRGAADFGSRVVTPALWASGVRRLDWLAVTHGDIDHVGGAIDIERDFHPREIWEGVPVPNNPELRALRVDAHAHHAVWRQLLAGHTFEVDSVLVDVLHPTTPDWERQRVRNDDSLVLRLRFGDVEVLLTGDAGREFESRLSPEDAHLPLRLLKVGHHGSRTSSSRGLVDTFMPQIAFVSAGRGNLFGHPTAEVLARLRRSGAIVFRTDLDGAIVIETNGAEVNVRTMSGRRWKFTVKR